MKKAILILAYKQPEQINLFINQLLYDTHNNTDVYVFIDKKHDNLKNDIVLNENIFLIKNNISVNWGDSTTLESLYVSLNEIKNYNKKYDYFIICTGQDLLVKPGLDQYLEQNNGKIFIDANKNNKWIKSQVTHPFPKWMCKYYNSSLLRLIIILYTVVIRTGIVPKKKVSFDYSKIDFWVSYNWSVMPYDVMCYLIDFINTNPGIKELYSGSMVPEDGFLGTMIMNSPYKGQVVMKDPGHSMSLTYNAGLKASHILLLNDDDIKDIDQSECYFARKFDIKSQPKVIQHYYNQIVRNKERKI